ncbi:hypothetical protein NDI76_07530 [Halogeometricum sp. S1BR25-6]|uniref:Uncharacterized protein n=1 Tax=Halogeometricum salsisoli TaxID=2950536 RepID=A0ABU2GCV9_9EURY|nr:hypothetical protein [Halogeometricum sp. S1BR25-6]MDS0298589.1 hypothetical protein [Halogeometricum sp. S1BR25-6]
MTDDTTDCAATADAARSGAPPTRETWRPRRRPERTDGGSDSDGEGGDDVRHWSTQ